MRRDPVTVLRIDVDTPAHQAALFRQLEEDFQDLYLVRLGCHPQHALYQSVRRVSAGAVRA